MLGKNALLFVSLLLTLGICEAAARFELLPLPDFVISSAWWEERWHRARRGLSPQAFIELDRELGFVPAAGLSDHRYQGAKISTNSAHIRGTREYPLERTEAARVVVVGDSYTFGQCANDDETYPAVMEATLPATEVLNLGVMGYGQGQALLRLRRAGFRYRPDIVVFGFHKSNMSRNLVDFKFYGKPRFRLTHSGLVLENVPVPMPEEYDRIWPPRLWNFARIFSDSLDWGTKPERQYIGELSRAIVRQMAADSEAFGMPLVVVHLPREDTLAGEGPYGWPFMEELCAQMEDERFRCVNPVDRFREIASTPEAIRHHFDCHYSPELYRAVGEATSELLLREFPDVFRAAVWNGP
jgi:hypothetical protein